jgi:hypothetical protein
MFRDRSRELDSATTSDPQGRIFDVCTLAILDEIVAVHDAAVDGPELA